jgi:hypothetical protein
MFMQLVQEQPQGIDNITRFLQSGTQTQITPEIQKISADFQGETIEKARQITSFLVRLPQTKFNEEVFRKRTAAQILTDNYVTGCTDSALVFVALARASGLPAKYVETIDRSWLEKGGSSIGGHIYGQVFDDKEKRWIWVDPMGGQVDIPVPSERVVYKEGLDSWDIGIKDFDSLQKLFDKFRNGWLEEQKN